MTALHSFNEIASMRIELTDTAPLIWREVDVPTSLTLRTLHEVIQATIQRLTCRNMPTRRHRMAVQALSDVVAVLCL